MTPTPTPLPGDQLRCRVRCFDVIDRSLSHHSVPGPMFLYYRETNSLGVPRRPRKDKKTSDPAPRRGAKTIRHRTRHRSSLRRWLFCFRSGWAAGGGAAVAVVGDVPAAALELEYGSAEKAACASPAFRTLAGRRRRRALDELEARSTAVAAVLVQGHRCPPHGPPCAGRRGATARGPPTQRRHPATESGVGQGVSLPVWPRHSPGSTLPPRLSHPRSRGLRDPVVVQHRRVGAHAAAAAVVALDATTLRPENHAVDDRPTRFPDVPALLLFRESSAVLSRSLAILRSG